MLNIDIDPNEPIRVHVSIQPVTVTRAGDIILFERSHDTQEIFPTRDPWTELFVSTSYSYNSGIENSNRIYDVIRLKSSNIFDMNILSTIDGQEFTMSLMQQNKNNGFNTAILPKSSIAGINIANNSITLAININKCEMIYEK